MYIYIYIYVFYVNLSIMLTCYTYHCCTEMYSYIPL